MQKISLVTKRTYKRLSAICCTESSICHHAEDELILRNYIYGWIYENGAKELKSRPKREFFFSPETSKGDDIKVKRKVSPFFLLLPVYLPFIAILSLLFACLHGLKAA